VRLEQVTAEGDYTVSTWDDTAFRDHLWAELRDKATVAASAKSMTLADREHRTVAFLYYVKDREGRAVAEETSRDHADVVRLRLSCWAELDSERQESPAGDSRGG